MSLHTSPLGDASASTAGLRRARTAIARVVGTAERTLRRLARRQRRDARRVEALLSRSNTLLDGYVNDPLLGACTVETSASRTARLQRRLHEDQEAGHLRHEPVHTLLRCTPAVVAVADLAVFESFLAGVFNVDWAHPLSAALLLSLTFAVGVTLVSFAALTLAGSRLRQRRDEDGAVPWPDLDATSYLVLIPAVAVALAVAALMYVRILTEVVSALGDTGRGIADALAGAFAVVSLVANVTVIAVHALDGSPLSHRAHHLSRRLSRRVQRAQSLRRRADVVARRMAIRERSAEQVHDLCAAAVLRCVLRLSPENTHLAGQGAPELYGLASIVAQVGALTHGARGGLALEGTTPGGVGEVASGVDGLRISSSAVFDDDPGDTSQAA